MHVGEEAARLGPVIGWRRIAHERGHDVRLKEFTLLGVLTVPAALSAATVALWGLLALLGP
ncbi:hypothetical protein ACIQKB_11165 [Streptomyces sp. NPDC092046]|uniref:hypothetical protein n=1 Tax=Streptomyces sp. NPDC092046 TaxID=3366009 RepID=UPI003813D4DF